MSLFVIPPWFLFARSVLAEMDLNKKIDKKNKDRKTRELNVLNYQQ